MTKSMEPGVGSRGVIGQVGRGENFDRLRTLITDATGGEATDGDEVRAFLGELSRRAGRMFPPAIRDELSPDAILSLLVERVGRFRPEGGNFASWCRAVLRNHAISLQRKLSRDAPGRSATGHGEVGRGWTGGHGGGRARLGADEQLQVEIQWIRRILDQVAWEPEGTERVDYYAVFLVDLRLAQEARLRKLAMEDPDSFPCPSQLIEFCLPWREREYDSIASSRGYLRSDRSGPPWLVRSIAPSTVLVRPVSRGTWDP